jgi:hypothetical protein
MSTMYHVMLTMYITNNRAVGVGAHADRKVAVDVLKRRHRHVDWLSGNVVHGLGSRVAAEVGVEEISEAVIDTSST